MINFGDIYIVIFAWIMVLIFNVLIAQVRLLEKLTVSCVLHCDI